MLKPDMQKVLSISIKNTFHVELQEKKNPTNTYIYIYITYSLNILWDKRKLVTHIRKREESGGDTPSYFFNIIKRGIGLIRITYNKYFSFFLLLSLYFELCEKVSNVTSTSPNNTCFLWI